MDRVSHAAISISSGSTRVLLVGVADSVGLVGPDRAGAERCSTDGVTIRDMPITSNEWPVKSREMHGHHVNANQTWYGALNDTPGRVGPPIEPPPARDRCDA